MNIDLLFDSTQFVLGVNYYSRSYGYPYSEFNIFLLFYRISFKF